jgi:hypothetical protein
VSQSWYGASRWKEKSDEEAKKRGKEMDLKKVILCMQAEFEIRWGFNHPVRQVLTIVPELSN